MFKPRYDSRLYALKLDLAGQKLDEVFKVLLPVLIRDLILVIFLQFNLRRWLIVELHGRI